MKKLFIIALMFSCIGTSGTSETIDVSTLSVYEKKMHRWGWCVSAVLEIPFDTLLDTKKILQISILLDDKNLNSRKLDPNNVYMKALTDVEAEILIGELEITQEHLDACDIDMVKILKDEYVPYFKYMEK